MIKGLEALEHLYAKLSCKSSIEEINENLQEYDIIEKELKALKIIRDKFVNVTIFMGCDSLEEYNKHPLTMRKGILTKEEYDLLKEVLL